jgi:glycosyltransferase involved in cell wall biosynthesis
LIPKAIHQFHSGSAYGDAVTNGMLFTKKILEEFGFESKIYVEHVAPEYKNEIEHFSTYISDEDNILLLHHSMGHDQDEWIYNLKDKIILVYHNITPETFFEKDSAFYNYSLKGRRQLDLLKEKSIASIGDSVLNIDELLSRGFNKDKSKVIPLLLDVDSIKSHTWNYNLYDKYCDTFNIVFVGRVAENKCQHEIIEIYNKFKQKTNLKTKCFIIGSFSNDKYGQGLCNLIDKYNLNDEVIITNKVESEDLYAYYRLADTFLCMSEHEGFGVPLVESMIFDVPVIAFDSSNIKNTLNGGGILIEEKNFDCISDILYKISTNRAFRREVLYKQREAVKVYENEYIKAELIDFLNFLNIDVNYKMNHKKDSSNITYQFEGPYDSSYSLAILNREMARSMNEKYPGSVSLFSTEGGGDFIPNLDFLKDMNDVLSMSKKSKKALRTNVLLRNLYPPRVNDMRGLINLMNSYGWEESSFPKEYIDNFNQYLDALPVMSKYVQKVMKDNGLVIPAPVIGVGVDHILKVEPKEYNLNTSKKFKFLHISSCFPRKGVDVLLDSYCASFDIHDDVCLVIKTFPNPHNNIEELIKQKQQENTECPEIELINIDLEDSYIVWLYKNSDCLVAPSRGEGYGMPMAEAMLFDLPVITTGYSGQVDFCTNDTAWLIDYTFEKVQSHMGLFNSYWANPKSEHLSVLMRDIVEIQVDDRLKKTIKAKQNILENHKWEDCIKRINNIVDEIQNKSLNEQKTNPKIGWVTTWNSKCGIATYSKFLIDQFSKENDIKIFANKLSDIDILNVDQELNVERIWIEGQTDLNEFYKVLLDSNIDTCIIQFNFGFFNIYALEDLIQKLILKDKKVLIEFHSVADVNKENFKVSLKNIKNTLQKVDKLLVHNIADLNILKDFDLINNVTLFPHGVQEINIDDSSVYNKKKELCIEGNFVISSYGFLLPQKGILELIKAFAIVKQQKENVYLLLVNAIYPVGESIAYAKECKELVTELNLEDSILMLNDFLSDEESLIYLKCSDLIVLPYKETKESASGAARYALSAKKPLLCTPQYIFKDVEDLVHYTEDDNISSLVNSLLKLINDKVLLNSKFNLQEKWIETHSWFNMSNRIATYLNLSQNKKQRIVSLMPKIKTTNFYVDLTTVVYSGANLEEFPSKKIILEKLIKIEELNIIPVYRDYKNNYCVANAFFNGYYDAELEINKQISLTKDDIYLSLETDIDIAKSLEIFYFMQKGLKRGTELIYYVVDILPVTHPEWFNNVELTEKFTKWIEFVALNSSKIICSTEHTRNEVLLWIEKYVTSNINIDFKIIHLDDEKFIEKLLKKSRKIV